ncbi:MAG TPA: sigma-70 family RNA polymerase sigma factor [Candidatus Paceibacterota bacterium]|nr:sigma-70 family RNA polymerase sigma factor [Candidatus Paceibacterota bacterium]
MDELIPTRATLLNRLKNLQDDPSWQDFYNIYSRLIRDLAIKAGMGRAEAEDVLQETMLAVARQMPTFKYDPSLGSFKSWLFTIAKCRIADQLRRRNPEYAENGGDTETGTRTVERIPDPAFKYLATDWEADWEKSVLAAAIANVKRRVDPEKYQIFDLAMNKEMASEKIAEFFSVTTNQVYLVKHRITELIREEVERLKTEMT